MPSTTPIPTRSSMIDPAIIRGAPLAEEPGLGALTMPGFLREVTTRFGPREALVLHEHGARISWSYADLWDRASEVASPLAEGYTQSDACRAVGAHSLNVVPRPTVTPRSSTFWAAA